MSTIKKDLPEILVITKRQYTNKDLLDDRYGRLRELPLGLALGKYKVAGLCLSYAKRNEGKTSDGPVEWHSLNAGILKVPGLIRFVIKAWRMANSSNLVLACSDSFYGIIGYFLSKQRNVPLIFDLYDNFEYFAAARFPLIKQLYRLVLRRAGAVICASHPLAGLVESYGRKDRLYVIENGVPNTFFRPMDKNSCRNALGLPREVHIVGTAGALTKNRGIAALLKAFDLLSDKHPHLHLALAGPRNVRIPQIERIHDLGILNYNTVPLFLNALDVAVICNSNNEFGKYCFPQKAREIMACDVPLVAARIGSMEELFKDHPSWLYTPDDPVDLARVLEIRLNDQKTDYEEPFTWKNAAKKLELIVSKLLKEAKRQ